MVTPGERCCWLYLLIHFQEMAVLLENLRPARSLAADERDEFIGGRIDGIDAHLVEPLPGRLVGIDPGDGVLDLLDDRARRARRRSDRDPGRAFVDRGKHGRLA